MRWQVVRADNRKPLSANQQSVFSKLLEIRGPKRWTKSAAERWRKGYYKAVKDFKDIYGFEPALEIMEEKTWKKFENL